VFKLFVIAFFFAVNLNALTLQKPNVYQEQNISGWLMSEKLDGIRAYWDGKNLLTRKGKLLHPPKWFIERFPEFELDGELWTKRGDFENIQSIVLDEVPDAKWNEIKYMIFEVPHVKGDFSQRLQKAQDYSVKNDLKHVYIIEQKTCKTKKELTQFLNSVLAKGGEGVIIKDGSKEYFEGRSSFVLKVKLAQDMEGKVIGYKEGKGKLKGRMGSLQVELDNKTNFYIGSGFSDEDRKNPPPLDSIVTFKYYGFTKHGKPKFASFMRVRKD